MNSINIVCEYIAKQWRSLGRNLGVTTADLERIELDYNQEGTAEIVYQMLQKWKSSSDEATIGSLISALHCIKRDDISQFIYDAQQDQ